MIAHLVLFKPRSDLGSHERQALAEAFSAAVTQIPSVRRARVGRRVTHGRPYEQLMAIDYSYAVVIEFDDMAGLHAYLNHPVHDRLAAQFFASFQHALMYDFELDEGREALDALLGDEHA